MSFPSSLPSSLSLIPSSLPSSFSLLTAIYFCPLLLLLLLFLLPSLPPPPPPLPPPFSPPPPPLPPPSSSSSSPLLLLFLFTANITIGRLGALLAYAYHLCKHYIRTNAKVSLVVTFLGIVTTWLFRFLIKAKFYEWLESMGGWVSQ